MFLYRECWSHFSNGNAEVFLCNNLIFNNCKLEPQSLLDLIIATTNQRDLELSLSDLTKLLDRFNGHFAIIFTINDKTFMVSDIIRSIPLFYFRSGDDVIITDYLIRYNEEHKCLTLSDEYLTEFIHSGFVIGKNTVFRDIYSLQAGEIVSICNSEFKDERYFKYIARPDPFIFNDSKAMADFLDNILMNVFSRMIKTYDQVNNWVIPLSGGHDSRIIANYLHKSGIKNVICYSYGYINNEQSRISKTVAETLGFTWHFVEYTAEKWHKLHHEGVIADFLPFGFNGTGSPCLQDFLAVHTLRELNVIGENDVIVPGHALDFIAGSHIEIDPKGNDVKKAVHGIIKKHAGYFNEKINKKVIYKHILGSYELLDVNPEDFAECFNWQERQAKFIANSLRTYEYLGLRWALPFWDRELVEFWLKVKKEDKIGRYCYLQAEKNGLLQESLLNIPFAGETGKRQKSPGMLDILKNLIPAQFKTLLVRLLKKETRINEGLNQLFSLEASSLQELIDPISFYPKRIRNLIKTYLGRYPYQINFQGITSLYTIKKVLTDNGFQFSKMQKK